MAHACLLEMWRKHCTACSGALYLRIAHGPANCAHAFCHAQDMNQVLFHPGLLGTCKIRCLQIRRSSCQGIKVAIAAHKQKLMAVSPAHIEYTSIYATVRTLLVKYCTMLARAAPSGSLEVALGTWEKCSQAVNWQGPRSG